MLSNLGYFYVNSNRLINIPKELSSLSRMITLDLSENNLKWIPRSIATISKFLTLIIHDNPEMCYPPAGTKEPIEYMKEHQDIISPSGRFEDAWKVIRLMLISYKHGGLFGHIPIELILQIEWYILSDPYVTIP